MYKKEFNKSSQGKSKQPEKLKKFILKTKLKQVYNILQVIFRQMASDGPNATPSSRCREVALNHRFGFFSHGHCVPVCRGELGI
jgi:hypothetical protein